MRSLRIALLLSVLALVLAACGAGGSTAGTTTNQNTPVIIAWLPNESGAELKDAREAIGAVISETLGRPVEHRTTTDYLIAIEAIANNNAHLGFFGAEGYVQARERNNKIVPLVIPSGADGTKETAVYYSWLAVMRGQEGNYQENGVFKIDNIQGKRFSFVSSSSTSGFRVPSASIVKYFGQQERWKGLTADDLIEGGANKFFSDVQFGGSHQGSAVNLLSGNVDVAAFCDACVSNYVELVSGEANRPGAVYRVIANADEPFDKFPGAEFVIISSTPVINAPFVANSGMLTADEIKRLQDALTSDAVANNPRIFATKAEIDAGFKPLFRKTQDERFIVVDDSFFEPIRALR
ncbi:phosphate/phosphite/phosphonate ABC transporter substrate-binding protein [Chloroflexus sp.]|uniref:phosphate/phosphite/phosphonate ABC transporter substrate-binding protein n=1 Tax=Chloroflexus sp. TaxID=1904827 RepID=UPI002617FF94|nr:phosphate/phosphite/phosphonate ABC transporter substrate-binding protein [uncultured Chloroflexus sp.]